MLSLTQPRICLSIGENNLDKLLSTIDKAQSIHNFLEIRVDYLDNLNLEIIKIIKQKLKVKAIFTCRSSQDGGQFQGSDVEQIEFLMFATDLGFEFIDVDWRLISNFKHKFEHTKIIVSYHHYQHTPSYLNLKHKLKKMRASVADIYKFACLVKSEKDLFKLYKLLLAKKSGEEMIVLGMGHLGKLSRVISPLLGGYLTFASLNTPTAPGQLSLQELQIKYNTLLNNSYV